jgi:cation:H+ antiporter
MTLVWAEFALCAAVILVAGSALSRQGDVIAFKTGYSRTWVGLVLLATATSLPELFTGVSAVTVASAPNIAVGDALGSCIFNLVLLVLLDAMTREETIYRRVEAGHILSAGFGVILIGFVGASLVIERETFSPSLWHIGWSTPIIIFVYFVAMRASFIYQRRQIPVKTVDPYPEISLRTATVGYLIAAAFVVAAGSWLPFVGLEIADAMGWGTTFVGTLIVAGATSLPELVVVLAALRIGAPDLAIASLLGSNLFDMLIIGIDDLAYTGGPLLSVASPSHAVTAFAAIVMSGIVVVALVYRPATRLAGTISWASLALLIVYLLSAYVIFLHGH